MAKPKKSTKAHFLVADEEMLDPNFARTVVLMIEHSEDGAMGIVLNRPLNRTIASVWEEIQEGEISCDAPVYWGGPVTGPLMAIHRVKALADVEVLPGVYFTTNKFHIDAIMHSDSPDLRFYIGCAGWAAGQLEAEIAEGAWKIVEPTMAQILTGQSDLWNELQKPAETRDIFKDLGIKKLPENPGLN